MKSIKKQSTITPLFFNHQIFIDKEQRYDLYAGKQIKTLGTCIEITNLNHPDEYKQPKEIFLEYIVDTESIEDKVIVTNNSYIIHIPVKFLHSEMEEIKEEKNDFVYLEDILDLEDGGREELFFKYRKIYANTDKKYICMHAIEIRDISKLENSLSFLNLN